MPPKYYVFFHSRYYLKKPTKKVAKTKEKNFCSSLLLMRWKTIKIFQYILIIINFKCFFSSVSEEKLKKNLKTSITKNPCVRTYIHTYIRKEEVCIVSSPNLFGQQNGGKTISLAIKVMNLWHILSI